MDDLAAIVAASDAAETSSEAPAQESAPVNTPVNTPPPAAAAPPVEKPKPAAPNGLKALLEKEKSLRDQENRLKAYEREVEEYREAQRLAKSNPGALLEKLGVSRDAIPAPQETDPTKQLAAQVAELQKYIADTKAREEESQRASAEDQAKQAMEGWIESVEGEFDAIKKVGAHGLVFDYIKAEHARTGSVISEEDAAREVDARLWELAETLHPLLEAKRSAKPPQGKSPSTITGAHVAAGGNPDLSKMSDEDALRYLVSLSD